jgi:CheY-like chemotaxis protein
MMPRRTILLADDDKVQTTMLTAALRAKGFSVATAFDATSAIMVAMRNPPDAVILDIQMPGGTGRAVLERLRGSTKTQKIPVIVLSGHSDRRIIEECKALGAFDYMTKPPDLEKLDAILRRALAIDENGESIVTEAAAPGAMPRAADALTPRTPPKP